MKIVIFEAEKWECDTFQPLCCDYELVTEKEGLDEEIVATYQDAEIISPFVYSDLSRAVLEQFKNLKFIATRSTGFDHIDLDYCNTKGIQISNVPTYGSNTVAEHVFALLLALSRNIPEAVNRTRRGDFSQKGIQGFDLQGKVLGVIGAGSIGARTIEIANGFHMKVLAHDLQEDKELESKLGFSYVSFEELLAQADIITLHVPGNKHTHHLLSDREFSQMKDGVILINTARGSIIDVKALLRGLSEGKVAGAGLDVLPEEPAIREEAELLRSFFTKEHDLETLLADHVLLHMRNVIITPHSAFNTKEAVQRILDTTAENIEAFCKGSPQNLVN